MRRKELTRFALVAALVLAAAPALAQNFPLDVELGYRFTNVAGNEEMYRSQINERSGFLLRSLTLGTNDFEGSVKVFDKFRLDVSDIGAGPAGSIRLDVGKSEIYRLRFTYSRWQMFSALPAFANPFLGSGIIPGQQTYDRLRNVYDVELEILPGKIFTPIFGYTYNLYSGPGATTVHVGQDEFRLTQDLRMEDQEPRVGFAFNTGPVSVNFMQGWRKYHEEETASLAAGAGAGNQTIPILGQQQTLNSYTRSSVTDVNIPVTTASAVYQFCGWGRILGTYVKATGSSDTQGPASLDGTLVDFKIASFFTGLAESVQSSSQNTFWRGAVRAEATLSDRIELTAGWRKRNRELTGLELLSEIFYNTTTYQGASTGTITQILNINNGLKRNDETLDAGVVLRSVGPFGFRASYGHTKQDTNLSEDVAEIVTPGGQEGYYDRAVNAYEGGVTFSQWGLTLGAEYRGEDANRAIVRSDFTNRNTWRAKAGYKFQKWLRINGNAQWVDESNSTTGINSSGQFRQYGGDIDIIPVEAFSLRFSGYEFKAQTGMPVLNPINLTPYFSSHLEDGYSLEGGIGLRLKALQLEVSGGEFKNSGSFAFKIDRVRGRLEVPLVKKFSLAGEIAYDKYQENNAVPTYGDFSATRVGVYAHWTAF